MHTRGGLRLHVHAWQCLQQGGPGVSEGAWRALRGVEQTPAEDCALTAGLEIGNGVSWAWSLGFAL